MIDKMPVSPKGTYHLRELEIALDRTDPGHIPPPPIDPGKRILDLGCGAGQTLMAAYSGRPAFGIDVDFEALKLGRSIGCTAPFACARGEALPFPDACFDVVIARVSLPYTNLRFSLREIRRVLRSGGVVWMVLHSFSVVWNAARRARPKGWLFFAYIVLNSLLFRVAGRQFACLGHRYESFQTAEGMRHALEGMAFQEICIDQRVTRWRADGRSGASNRRYGLLVITARAI